MVSDAISCPLHNFNSHLVYYHHTLQLCRTGHDDVSRRARMRTLAFILSALFLMVSDAISCPLHNLNTLWYIIMILYGYVEQVMTMCRMKE